MELEELQRKIKQGFQIDSPSLQGFMNSINKHFNPGSSTEFRVNFKDGSAQKFSDASEIGLLPNIGRKEISSIDINVIDSSNSLKTLNVNVSDPTAAGEKRDAFEYRVNCDDLVWGRSVQIECDEFSTTISKNRITSWMMDNQSIVSIIPMVAIMFALAYLSSNIDNSSHLDSLSRRLGDTMSAARVTLEYERWKESNDGAISLKWLFVPMTFSMLWVVLMSKNFLNSIFKTYIFYMGGMIQIVNQRRTMHAIFWVSIVLAIFIGIGVNWISARYIH